MDLQVVVIGAIVFVVSSVFIYFISAFSMRTQTFDDAIKEQKRRLEEEREKAKQEKKLIDKKKKKSKEKAKEKNVQVQVSEPELKEHKMVNLEIEPEVIEPLDMPPQDPKRNSKKKAAKPILINKDEKPMITQTPAEYKHGGAPKDDLELKHEHDKQLKKSVKESISSKGSKKEKQEKLKEDDSVPVIEEQIVQKETTVKVQSGPPPSEGRNEKKTGPMGDAVDNSKLISSVKTAALSDIEVQTLLNILHTKQDSSSTAPADVWNRKSQKGDPVALLRKQLEEKERALQEEQQLAMSASTKLKEVQKDLAQEKSRFTGIEKNYKDKIDYQAQEIQALLSRMQQTHEQHMTESSQLRARLEAQASEQAHMQRLIEENKTLRDSLAKTRSDVTSTQEYNSLKEKCSIVEKELSSTVIKLNASENARKTLEQKIRQHEEQLKKLESSQKSTESVLDKRVEEVTSELRKTEAHKTSLEKELHAAKKALDTAHNDVGSLKTQLHTLEKSISDSDLTFKEMENRLQETERLKQELEGNLKNLEKKLADNSDVHTVRQEAENLKSNLENNLKNLEKKLSESERQNAELETKLKSLQQENESLSTEIKITKERQVGEGQDAPRTEPVGAPNGHVSNTTEEDACQITLTEHKKLLSEKETEISRLVVELDSKKSDLSKLMDDLENQKKKNNDLREKNWKAMDALEKSEKSLSEKVQSALKSTKDELSSILLETEKYDRTMMQKLFPDITVKDSLLVHRDWVSEFEKQATDYLSTLSKVDNRAEFESKVKALEERNSELEIRLQEQEAQNITESLQSQITELEENNSKLESQIKQYRSVLSDTENQLTQLEQSVETEEQKWQDRLKSKDAELEQVKQESVSLREQLLRSQGSTEMKVKLESLESQLHASENRCVQLQEDVDKCEEKIKSLELKLTETEKSNSELPDLQKELDELRRLLEEERKKNKELASQTVRLNGIIKTGHDALAQEQNLVRDLRQQLAEKQNGSLPAGSNTEIAVMKAKLEEKEKQLEKEISNNKALSQKLVSF
ncbi:hypothetical protein CHS0354_036010 [Potamilus streckersoni]|uniref:Uncharacterized protein n=1 Tax=Potamilus streckersoni TaxID=2493646 RepID=A0AAE0RMX8_9BIVA|nr:hypothetical protein CHS0354_036010 [Potamilus streckersoni]